MNGVHPTKTSATDQAMPPGVARLPSARSQSETTRA